MIKYKLFGLFFRLNTIKFSIAIHYYIIMVGVETF